MMILIQILCRWRMSALNDVGQCLLWQWLNLCVDMRSLMSGAWSDTAFSSLEGITISGCCKLRRIFTMRRQAPDTTDDDGNRPYFLFLIYLPLQWFDIVFLSVLWHCWLGERKGIWSVESWVLVCWWWWFDWSSALLYYIIFGIIAPVVTTRAIILSSNKIQNGDILVPANRGPPGKWLLNRR